MNKLGSFLSYYTAVTEDIVEEYVAVPKELVSRHKFISMAADVFFVADIAFLIQWQ